MIHRLAETLDDLHVAVGVCGGIGDDFLEQVHFHKAGAAECSEHAAFGKEFHRKHVDVFVTACTFLQIVFGFHEFWRIEHDEIECLGSVAALAQVLEHVGFYMGRFRCCELVAHDAILGELERVFGYIDLINFFAAATEGVKAESARVAEAVEHFFACGQFANASSGIALVEVVARLVAVLHVDREEDAVLVDDDGFVRNFAKDDSCAEGEAFFFADFGVATFINAAAARLFGEELVNGLAVDFGPGGEDFNRVDVSIFVDDTAGNAVVFGVDQSESVCRIRGFCGRLWPGRECR